MVKLCWKYMVNSYGSSKRNEKKNQIYLHTKVQSYIILVKYMENDKINCLHIHILDLVLNERAHKIYFPK